MQLQGKDQTQYATINKQAPGKDQGVWLQSHFVTC